MSLYKVYDMETITQDKLNELALERNNLAEEVERLKEENTILFNKGLEKNLEIRNRKDKEIKRLKDILNELPDSLLKELDEREQDSITILDYDGNEEIMDMAEAWGGMEFFVKEFKHKVKMLIEEENK